MGAVVTTVRGVITRQHIWGREDGRQRWKGRKGMGMELNRALFVICLNVADAPVGTGLRAGNDRLRGGLFHL